jgi:hypothetical protein
MMAGNVKTRARFTDYPVLKASLILDRGQWREMKAFFDVVGCSLPFLFPLEGSAEHRLVVFDEKLSSSESTFHSAGEQHKVDVRLRIRQEPPSIAASP